MDNEQQDLLIAWLNDAHAMELSLVKNLEGKAKDAEKAGKLSVKEKIEEHIEETKRHADLVENCIERLGGKVSGGKDVLGKVVGLLQGAMNSMFEDTMVKNALESYAAEHFEIGVYTSLIAAAEELGDTETADICTSILEDEKDTAEWLIEQIPLTTVEQLNERDEED